MNHRHPPLPAALCLILGIGAPQSIAQDLGLQEIPGVRERTGQLLLTPGGLRRAAALEVLADLEVVRHALGPDRFVVRLPEGSDEDRWIDELQATGAFDIVEPDWRLFPIGCPNDSLFGNQWHHDASKLDSCDAWDLETGLPAIVVAMCDTGLRVTHQDFQLHRREGYNAVDQLWENQGGDISPVTSHGTQTSGCAAANGNNAVGVSGVGWNLGHRMMRVSNDPSGSSNLSWLLDGAETAIESGDRVASVSYSGVDSFSIRTSATYIKSLNGLLVWAAGNDSRFLDWGNRDADDLIVAGGTDSADARSSFSAYGPSVDVMAPATNVYTTSSGSDSDYASVSGTSFATPLTAGLCGLIWSLDPNLSPNQVEWALKIGCDDLGSVGVDDTFSYGRIDARASLEAVDYLKPAGGLLVSTKDDTTIGAVSADGLDIVRFDLDTLAASLYFDASDVLSGSGAGNLFGFAVLVDGSILMTFKNTATISGLVGGPNGDVVEAQDLVQFVPTSLGDNTAGTFHFYFDGSDVGLDLPSENLTGVSVDAAGRLYLTTKGAFAVAGLSGKNEDVFQFSPSGLGANTSGTFSAYLDGNSSSVRLGKAGEQVSAVHYNSDGSLLVSTQGDFRVPFNLLGDDDDLLFLGIDQPGVNTIAYALIILDGADLGLAADNIDGLHLLD